MEPRRLPSLQEVEESHKVRLVEKVRTMLQGGAADLPSKDKYRSDVDGLIREGFDPADIASALMSLSLYVASTASEETMVKAPARIVDDDTMVKLFFSLGRKQKIYVKDLLGAIAATCGVPQSAIGHIDILETFSYVEVPSSVAADILKLMDKSQIKHQTVHVELASDKNSRS